MPERRVDLGRLASHLNEQARATIEADGEHAAMFFLADADGRVTPQLFPSDEERPVVARRARVLGDAVAASGAVAAAFVSEAWAAPESSTEGGAAGDSPAARDILIVAAIDASAYVAFETPVVKAADGTVVLGKSASRGPSDEAEVFREAWAHWHGQAARPEGAEPARRRLLDRFRRRA